MKGTLSKNQQVLLRNGPDEKEVDFWTFSNNLAVNSGRLSRGTVYDCGCRC